MSVWEDIRIMWDANRTMVDLVQLTALKVAEDDGTSSFNFGAP